VDIAVPHIENPPRTILAGDLVGGGGNEKAASGAARENPAFSRVGKARSAFFHLDNRIALCRSSGQAKTHVATTSKNPGILFDSGLSTNYHLNFRIALLDQWSIRTRVQKKLLYT
jgi:hypothetical protein